MREERKHEEKEYNCSSMEQNEPYHSPSQETKTDKSYIQNPTEDSEESGEENAHRLAL